MGYRGGPAKTEEDTKNLIRHLEEHKGLEVCCGWLGWVDPPWLLETLGHPTADRQAEEASGGRERVWAGVGSGVESVCGLGR